MLGRSKPSERLSWSPRTPTPMNLKGPLLNPDQQEYTVMTEAPRTREQQKREVSEVGR